LPSLEDEELELLDDEELLLDELERFLACFGFLDFLALLVCAGGALSFPIVLSSINS